MDGLVLMPWRLYDVGIVYYAPCLSCRCSKAMVTAGNTDTIFTSALLGWTDFAAMQYGGRKMKSEMGTGVMLVVAGMGLQIVNQIETQKALKSG